MSDSLLVSPSHVDDGNEGFSAGERISERRLEFTLLARNGVLRSTGTLRGALRRAPALGPMP